MSIKKRRTARHWGKYLAADLHVHAQEMALGRSLEELRVTCDRHVSGSFDRFVDQLGICVPLAWELRARYRAASGSPLRPPLVANFTVDTPAKSLKGMLEFPVATALWRYARHYLYVHIGNPDRPEVGILSCHKIPCGSRRKAETFVEKLRKSYLVEECDETFELLPSCAQ
jgi:hypothetical protein